jgi:hypothetical protein
VGVEAGEKDQESLGIDLGWIGSHSRNGDNRYLTTSASARVKLRPEITLLLDAPFVYLRTERQIGTQKHIFESWGPGDLAAGIRVDLGRIFLHSSAPPAPAAKADRNGALPAKPKTGQAPLNLYVGFNLRLPTGSSALWYEDASGARVYFPAEAQIGMGLWKPSLSLTLYRGFGPVFPLFVASYAYARMVNRIGILHSDVANFAGGALVHLSVDLDLRVTGLILATCNLYNLKTWDRTALTWRELRGSKGWLWYGEIDLSIKVWRSLAFETGVLFPLAKTLEESPNDLDFMVKGGFRLRM